MVMQITQLKELHEEMRQMELMVTQKTNTSGQLMTLLFQSTLLEKIKEAQSGTLRYKNSEIKWRLD